MLEAEVIGAKAQLATGFLTGYDHGSDVDNTVKVTAAVQGSELFSQAKVLLPKATQTISTDGALLDNATPTTNGLTAILHVFSINGATPNLTVKIQHSIDNITWSDLITATGLTTSTAVLLQGSGTINRYLRVVSVLGAGTTNATLQVAAARL